MPGLLISFAARLDAAKALVGMMSGGRRQGVSLECRQSCCAGGGYYFIPIVVAYAIGLLMANVAVYMMEMGQPALLYLVPCTLGTMTFLGWRRHELRSLWDGPNVLRSADQIVYGAPPGQSRQGDGGTGASNTKAISGRETTTTVDEEEGNQAGDEVVDDDEGDVPLLQTSKAVKSASTMSSSSSSGE